jgi:CRISPR-associated endoribonuclease Cas6
MGDSTGWADTTDWQRLASAEARKSITIRFASPTAFSLGDRRFALFPDPLFVWDSLMRSWNLYAPEPLHVEKQPLRKFIIEQIMVSAYDLQTTTYSFPNYVQKGFVGTCTYQMSIDATYAPQVAALAAFAQYAGIGYKTTMGMGQTRLEAPHTTCG